MVRVRTLSAALAALVLSGGVAAAAVATNDLNIRAKPGPDSQVVGVIPAGQSVATLGCQDGWCKVRYASHIGFASESYLRGEGRGAAVMVTGKGVYDNDPGFGFGFGNNKW